MAIIKSGTSYDHLTVQGTVPAMRTVDFTGLGRMIARQSEKTFMVSASFSPPATSTDMIQIMGSASKVVRVYSIYFGTTATAAGSNQYFVLRRNSPNIITTVNFVMPGIIALDTQDAPTAIAGHYTATAPAAANLGQTIGNINIVRWAATVVAPGNFAGIAREAGKEILPWATYSLMDKFITLRGPGQTLAVNHNSVAMLGGQVNTYRIVWTESDT
jgi:hypothetical protein